MNSVGCGGREKELVVIGPCVGREVVVRELCMKKQG